MPSHTKMITPRCCGALVMSPGALRSPEGICVMSAAPPRSLLFTCSSPQPVNRPKITIARVVVFMEVEYRGACEAGKIQLRRFGDFVRHAFVTQERPAA